MSLITRCPACETLFKVVPDQLRISQGWVRCGQCSEVFDASLHMLPVTAQVVDAAEPVQASEVVSPDVLTPASASIDINLDESPPGEDLVDTRTVPPLALPVKEDEPLTTSTHASVPECSPDSVRPSIPFAIPVHVIQHASDDVGEGVERAAGASFLRPRPVESTWHKPIVLILLIFLSLLLLLGLTAQLLFHERDRLVAREPRLTPYFQGVCELLNCTIEPLKHIDAIVIDSSTFVKIRADAYRLNFTLKNKALTSLAAPAVEVTLTNSLDQPVLRRVFYPEQWGASSNALSANVELSASIALTAKTETSGDRVAGYRLLAFYPR